MSFLNIEIVFEFKNLFHIIGYKNTINKTGGFYNILDKSYNLSLNALPRAQRGHKPFII